MIVTYTNWKGKRGERNIVPARLYFGRTEHHPEPGWLLEVWDLDKDAVRTYALARIEVPEGTELIEC